MPPNAIPIITISKLPCNSVVSACERIAVTAKPVIWFGGLFPVTTLRLSLGDFKPFGAVPQRAVRYAVAGNSA
jgi:hypothetical protein